MSVRSDPGWDHCKEVGEDLERDPGWEHCNEVGEHLESDPGWEHCKEVSEHFEFIGHRSPYRSSAADASSQSQSVSSHNPDAEQSLEATTEKEENYAKARKVIANFWYFCNIPFNVARSSYYEAMVNALIVCGVGFKPSTYDDYRGSLLDQCVEDVDQYIEEQKKIWMKKGCTIIFDGWMNGKGETLINVLVSSAGGFVFLKSVDTSNKIKTGQTLFTLLEDAVLEIGPQNVVQIVTDNTTAYMIAGKLLEERFPTIFWTPCIDHCIDLILEDIGKINWVKETMDNAKKITKYIYNDSWVLNLMRKFTNEREIVRPGVTQFVTNFLTLQSLHSRSAGLKRMFVCEEWIESSFSTSEEALHVTNIIFDERFWETSHEIIQVSEPLLKVLHVVGSQDKSPVGYLYEAMEKVKDAIAKYYKNIEAKYRPVWELIDRRWSCQLHKPIYAAGYYLDPKYFYDEAFVVDEEVLNGLYVCLEKMVQDEQKMDDILRELQIYKNAEGCLFSSALCITTRTTQNPAIWWESFGAKTPLLQQIAVRILSQPCSSFGCEHNWSMFEHIHSKKRNRLAQEQLNNLVYVCYNLILRHKQINGAEHDVIDLDEIDPSSEWITKFETRQPVEGDDLLSIDDFPCIANQVAQVVVAMEEAQVQAHTSKTFKRKGKKRALH